MLNTIKSMLGIQPISYPDNNSYTEQQIIDFVLTHRENLKKFHKILGHMSCPFSRDGVKNKDIMFFTEFGAAGPFSCLIINGQDVTVKLPYRLNVSKLVYDGIVEYWKPVRTMIDK
jgi:hypothetical protein